MKLNIKKNIIIGLKGLVASIVAGIITSIIRTIIVSAGVVADSQAVWALALLIGIPVGLYVWGWLVNKWWSWK